MQIGQQDIARRYAQAFFSLAGEQGQIDRVATDFQTLSNMLAASEDFVKFINNVTMQRANQAAAMGVLAGKAGLSPLTQKLLGTLAMKRRLAALPGVIAAVADKIAAHKGEITAHVTAAQELDAAQVTAIAAALKKSLGVNVKVNLSCDPAILGGLVVKIGSQQIDSSVQAKLIRLKRALKNSNASTKEVA